LWFDERGGLPSLDAPSTFDQHIHDTTNPIIAPYVTNRGLFGRLNRPNFHAVETSFAPGSQTFFVGPVEAVNGFWVARAGRVTHHAGLTVCDQTGSVHAAFGTPDRRVEPLFICAGLCWTIMYWR